MNAARPVACITGASSGIGAEFARQLAAQGFDLLLVARGLDRLQSLANELAASAAVMVELFPVDLGNAADRLRLEQRLAEEPRLELLINNAGFGTLGKFQDIPVDGQEQMVQVHVLAPLRLIHAVLPGMIARHRGGVINLCSTAGFFPLPGNVSYSSTKAGLKMFSEALAMDLVGAGVSVQALCPGFTRTNFHTAMDFDPNQIHGFPWMMPDQVVSTSLRAWRKGRSGVVIPGFRNRLIVTLGSLVPHRLVRLVMTGH